MSGAKIIMTGRESMRKYQISIPDAMNRQITAAHKKSKFSKMLPSQFIKHLVTMGLKEYQAQCEIKQENIGVRNQSAGCDNAPYMIPERHTGGKVIPFPGVVLKDDFQSGLDDFLREIGYVE